MDRYAFDFDTILDRCLTDIHSGRASLEECLAAYPEYQSDLRVLLALSLRLSSGKDLKASPEFRERALARFNSMPVQPRQAIPSQRPVSSSPYPVESIASRAVLTKPTSNRNNRRPYFSYSIGTISIILIVLSLLTTSIAFAANQSKPGSAFYPIKITLENVELNLSTTEAGDQQLHIRFAARRLAEVEKLLQNNRPYLIDQAINNYSDHLNELIIILNSPGITEQERHQIAEKILTSASFDDSNLTILSQRIPAEQRAGILDALQAARLARQQAAQVLDNLPTIRDQIRQSLINTVSAPLATPTDQSIIVSEPSPTLETPVPTGIRVYSPTDDWSLDLPKEIPDWTTGTPDWSRLATQYPAVYPTLAALATQFPDLRSTPRPYIVPTRVRPPITNPRWQVPTVWPTLPATPTR